MSTIKTTNITHGSNSGTANLVLASDGGITYAKKPALGRQILEQFFTPCDGSVIATSAGNVTVEDTDAVQHLTTSFVDATGSTISYTPPAGTTQVIYEFYAQVSRGDGHAISHWKFFIDSDEVTDNRCTISSTNMEDRVPFKWGINIGGSAVTATGRLASWTSAKTLKLQARDYHSNHEARIHSTEYWDGDGTDQFVRPCIGITAIG
mgnify:CR=1 FL=1|tara:strand:+ start:1267 stop:1887 length:621 start_codon:yes stop_codon:yes gene_type:complete